MTPDPTAGGPIVDDTKTDAQAPGASAAQGASMTELYEAAVAREDHGQALGHAQAAMAKPGADPLVWSMRIAVHAKQVGELGTAASSYRSFMDQSALLGSPIERWVPIERAAVCEALGLFAEALAMLNLAMAWNEERAAWLALRAADVAVLAGLDEASLKAVFHQAILRNPENRELLLRYGNTVFGKARVLDYVDSLVELQFATRTILPNVVLEIARWPDHRPTDERAKFLRLKLGEDPVYVALEAVVRCYAQARRPNSSDLSLLTQVSDAVLQVFHTVMMPLRTVSMFDPNPRDVDTLRGRGVDLAAFARAFDEAVLGLSPAWRLRLDDALFATPYARERAFAFERLTGFQDRIVRERTFRCPDPFRPEIMLEACDSFCRWDRTLFTFCGTQVFHVVVGDGSSEILGIYLPGLDYIVHVRPGISAGLASAEFAWLQAAFLARLLAMPDEAQSAFDRSRDQHRQPRRLIGCLGCIPNLAHEVWNSLSGVERLAQAGMLGELEELVVFGSEFYGSVQSVFPETAALQFLHIEGRTLFDPAPFSVDTLVLPIGGWFIVDELRNRIAEHANASASERTRDWFSDVGRGRPGPIVWFGIRTNDKAWLDQASGIVAVMGAVREAFADARFVLDGFSLPVGKDVTSADWVSERASLRALASTIVAGGGGPSQVHDLTDMSLADATYASLQITAYVCPLGTSQHKAAWISGKPGIVYGSPAWERVSIGERPGSFEAESVPIPVYVPSSSTVVDGGNHSRGLTDERVYLDNFAIDHKAISGMLIGLISSFQIIDAGLSRRPETLPPLPALRLPPR